jgi:hypothetical protein
MTAKELIFVESTFSEDHTQLEANRHYYYWRFYQRDPRVPLYTTHLEFRSPAFRVLFRDAISLYDTLSNACAALELELASLVARHADRQTITDWSELRLESIELVVVRWTAGIVLPAMERFTVNGAHQFDSSRHAITLAVNSVYTLTTRQPAFDEEAKKDPEQRFEHRLTLELTALKLYFRSFGPLEVSFALDPNLFSFILGHRNLFEIPSETAVRDREYFQNKGTQREWLNEMITQRTRDVHLARARLAPDAVSNYLPHVLDASNWSIPDRWWIMSETSRDLPLNDASDESGKWARPGDTFWPQVTPALKEENMRENTTLLTTFYLFLLELSSGRRPLGSRERRILSHHLTMCLLAHSFGEPKSGTWFVLGTDMDTEFVQTWLQEVAQNDELPRLFHFQKPGSEEARSLWQALVDVTAGLETTGTPRASVYTSSALFCYGFASLLLPREARGNAHRKDRKLRWKWLDGLTGTDRIVPLVSVEWRKDDTFLFLGVGNRYAPLALRVEGDSEEADLSTSQDMIWMDALTKIMSINLPEGSTDRRGVVLYDAPRLLEDQRSTAICAAQPLFPRFAHMAHLNPTITAVFGDSARWWRPLDQGTIIEQAFASFLEERGVTPSLRLMFDFLEDRYLDILALETEAGLADSRVAWLDWFTRAASSYYRLFANSEDFTVVDRRSRAQAFLTGRIGNQGRIAPASLTGVGRYLNRDLVARYGSDPVVVGAEYHALAERMADLIGLVLQPAIKEQATSADWFNSYVQPVVDAWFMAYDPMARRSAAAAIRARLQASASMSPALVERLIEQQSAEPAVTSVEEEETVQAALLMTDAERNLLAAANIWTRGMASLLHELGLESADELVDLPFLQLGPAAQELASQWLLDTVNPPLILPRDPLKPEGLNKEEARSGFLHLGRAFKGALDGSAFGGIADYFFEPTLAFLEALNANNSRVIALLENLAKTAEVVSKATQACLKEDATGRSPPLWYMDVTGPHWLLYVRESLRRIFNGQRLSSEAGRGLPKLSEEQLDVLTATRLWEHLNSGLERLLDKPRRLTEQGLSDALSYLKNQALDINRSRELRESVLSMLNPRNRVLLYALQNGRTGLLREMLLQEQLARIYGDQHEMRLIDAPAFALLRPPSQGLPTQLPLHVQDLLLQAWLTGGRPSFFALRDLFGSSLLPGFFTLQAVLLEERHDPRVGQTIRGLLKSAGIVKNMQRFVNHLRASTPGFVIDLEYLHNILMGDADARSPLLGLPYSVRIDELVEKFSNRLSLPLVSVTRVELESAALPDAEALKRRPIVAVLQDEVEETDLEERHRFEAMLTELNQEAPSTLQAALQRDILAQDRQNPGLVELLARRSALLLRHGIVNYDLVRADVGEPPQPVEDAMDLDPTQMERLLQVLRNPATIFGSDRPVVALRHVAARLARFDDQPTELNEALIGATGKAVNLNPQALTREAMRSRQGRELYLGASAGPLVSFLVRDPLLVMLPPIRFPGHYRSLDLIRWLLMRQSLLKDEPAVSNQPLRAAAVGGAAPDVREDEEQQPALDMADESSAYPEPSEEEEQHKEEPIARPTAEPVARMIDTALLPRASIVPVDLDDVVTITRAPSSPVASSSQPLSLEFQFLEGQRLLAERSLAAELESFTGAVLPHVLVLSMVQRVQELWPFVDQGITPGRWNPDQNYLPASVQVGELPNTLDVRAWRAAELLFDGSEGLSRHGLGFMEQASRAAARIVDLIIERQPAPPGAPIREGLQLSDALLTRYVARASRRLPSVSRRRGGAGSVALAQGQVERTTYTPTQYQADLNALIAKTKSFNPQTQAAELNAWLAAPHVLGADALARQTLERQVAPALAEVEATRVQFVLQQFQPEAEGQLAPRMIRRIRIALAVASQLDVTRPDASQYVWQYVPNTPQLEREARTALEDVFDTLRMPRIREVLQAILIKESASLTWRIRLLTSVFTAIDPALATVPSAASSLATEIGALSTHEPIWGSQRHRRLAAFFELVLDSQPRIAQIRRANSASSDAPYNVFFGERTCWRLAQLLLQAQLGSPPSDAALVRGQWLVEGSRDPALEFLAFFLLGITRKGVGPETRTPTEIALELYHQ